MKSEILKAAVSAAKWLIPRVKDNPKLNPVPYPFFKSIVSKQIEWGKSQRGVILGFSELAQATRFELLKSGIHVMAESGKGKSEAPKAAAKNGVSAEFVCNGCEGRNVDKNKCPLYNVVVRSQRAGENVRTFVCAFYHDSQNCQTPATGENLNQEDSLYE